MSFVKKYKELNEQLDELFMEEFGRCDRNNIDIKNLNPPVLLQTVAMIDLIDKLEVVIEENKKFNKMLEEKINTLLENKKTDNVETPSKNTKKK